MEISFPLRFERCKSVTEKTEILIMCIYIFIFIHYECKFLFTFYVMLEMHLCMCEKISVSSERLESQVRNVFIPISNEDEEKSISFWTASVLIVLEKGIYRCINYKMNVESFYVWRTEEDEDMALH